MANTHSKKRRWFQQRGMQGEKKKINGEGSRVGKQCQSFTLSTPDEKERPCGATQVLASYPTGIRFQQASMTSKCWLPGPGLLTGRENSAQPETGSITTSRPISSFPLQRRQGFFPVVSPRRLALREEDKKPRSSASGPDVRRCPFFSSASCTRRQMGEHRFIDAAAQQLWERADAYFMGTSGR